MKQSIDAMNTAPASTKMFQYMRRYEALGLTCGNTAPAYPHAQRSLTYTEAEPKIEALARQDVLIRKSLGNRFHEILRRMIKMS